MRAARMPAHCVSVIVGEGSIGQLRHARAKPGSGFPHLRCIYPFHSGTSSQPGDRNRNRLMHGAVLGVRKSTRLGPVSRKMRVEMDDVRREQQSRKTSR